MKKILRPRLKQSRIVHPDRLVKRTIRQLAITIILFLLMVPTAQADLALNIFPQETYIDLDAPGVNGFEINYQLFGSQGQAQAQINYFYCDDPNPDGSSECYLIGSFNILLNCNGTLCIPDGFQNTHFISEFSLPTGFTDYCFSGDWYIIGQVVGSSNVSLNTNPTAPVEFAHSRPDLVPLDMEVTTNPNFPGQIFVNCTIANNGACPAPASSATVWLTPDAGVPVAFDVPFLPAFSSVMLSIPYNGLVPGTLYDGQLRVDVFSQIEETDENNNTLDINSLFDFPLPPTIDAISPGSGLVGSTLTITGGNNLVGSNFLDVSTVLFGSQSATILTQNATTLEVEVPYYISDGPITLVTIYGTTSTSSDIFTVLCSPENADLESGALPVPWAIENDDNSRTFEVTGVAGAGGSNNSLVMDHRGYTNTGTLDILVLPEICIDDFGDWKLRFDFAYAPYTDGVNIVADDLFIAIAEASGPNIVFGTSGLNLATAAPQGTTYVPADNEWISLELDLNSYIAPGQDAIYIVIFTQNQNGNAMYFDNIRVEEALPLDVELIEFTAEPQAETVLLQWSTASEDNNAYFVIERSTDGNDFKAIAQVDGQGTTSALTQYQSVDKSPETGNNYYRLRQVDFDGSVTFSKIVEVFFEAKAPEALGVFPNPGNGVIQFSPPVPANAQLQVLNLQGQTLASYTQVDEGILDLSHLPDGTYILQLIAGDRILSSRYVKLTE